MQEKDYYDIGNNDEENEVEKMSEVDEESRNSYNRNSMSKKHSFEASELTNSDVVGYEGNPLENNPFVLVYGTGANRYVENTKEYLKGLGITKENGRTLHQNFKAALEVMLHNHVSVGVVKNMNNNIHDIGYVVPFIFRALDVNIVNNDTASYVKKTVKEYVFSDTLRNDYLKDFYDSLLIKREDKDKTVESQNEEYKRKSANLTNKEKLDLKLQLARELGPSVTGNKDYLGEALASYAKIKNMHNHFFRWLFHPKLWSREKNAIREMESVLMNKYGLTQNYLNNVSLANNTCLVDKLDIAVEVMTKETSSLAINNIHANKAKAESLMYDIENNIRKEFYEQIDIVEEAIDERGKTESELGHKDFDLNTKFTEVGSIVDLVMNSKAETERAIRDYHRQDNVEIEGFDLTKEALEDQERKDEFVEFYAMDDHDRQLSNENDLENKNTIFDEDQKSASDIEEFDLNESISEIPESGLQNEK